jgi:hypothetical protein
VLLWVPESAQCLATRPALQDLFLLRPSVGLSFGIPSWMTAKSDRVSLNFGGGASTGLFVLRFAWVRLWIMMSTVANANVLIAPSR